MLLFQRMAKRVGPRQVVFLGFSANAQMSNASAVADKTAARGSFMIAAHGRGGAADRILAGGPAMRGAMDAPLAMDEQCSSSTHDATRSLS